MQTIYKLVMGIIGVIVRTVLSVDSLLREAMTSAHLDPTLQQVLLLLATIAMAVAAVRLFGGLLGLLLLIFLILFALNIGMPSLMHSLATH